MELLTIQVGGPGVVFARHNRVRLPFTFSSPVAGASALLQSFRFINHDEDTHLKDVQVQLTPLFNAAESATQGEVEIETTFRDEGPSLDRIEMEVVVLVVGT